MIAKRGGEQYYSNSVPESHQDVFHVRVAPRRLRPVGRGLHSFTSQLSLSRFNHTSLCPPV